jgi:hypothetical protein
MAAKAKHVAIASRYAHARYGSQMIDRFLYWGDHQKPKSGEIKDRCQSPPRPDTTFSFSSRIRLKMWSRPFMSTESKCDVTSFTFKAKLKLTRGFKFIVHMSWSLFLMRWNHDKIWKRRPSFHGYVVKMKSCVNIINKQSSTIPLGKYLSNFSLS